MSKIGWDRLLEMCVRRDRNAILVEGFPPCWRFAEGLAMAEIEPLSGADLAELADYFARPPFRAEELPGCRSVRVAYSDDHFRIDTLGDGPRVFTITRLPADAPREVREGTGWHRGWSAVAGAMSWSELLRRSDGDAIMAEGCPPCAWTGFGLQFFDGAPLHKETLASTVNHITRGPGDRNEPQGFIDLCVMPEGGHGLFRAGVFTRADPRLVLFMKLPSCPDHRGDAERRGRLWGDQGRDR